MDAGRAALRLSAAVAACAVSADGSERGPARVVALEISGGEVRMCAPTNAWGHAARADRARSTAGPWERPAQSAWTTGGCWVVAVPLDATNAFYRVWYERHGRGAVR